MELTRTRKIVVHDYAGHPFQVQLSRKLAERGYEVHHLYFAADATPRGALRRLPGDPDTLSIVPVSLATAFQKYALVKRVLQEAEYGRLVAATINEIAPDVLINANVPIAALTAIRRRCKIPFPDRSFVIWLQDILSVGVGKLTREKLPLIGSLVGDAFHRAEKRNLNAADHIVCITQDFIPLLQGWRVDTGKCSVVENWAAIDEIRPFAGPSPWRKEHGLEGKRIVLYGGTLGFKHDPSLLIAAARALAADPACADVALVVVAEGIGVDMLRAEKERHGLANLHLMPFQRYERLSEIFSQAEILLAVLSDNAGIFSVPSKVLGYMCAGRPILLSAPEENLATATVRRAGAGIGVRPGDHDGFVSHLTALLEEPGRAAELGRNARAYAERTFDIETIADRFEQIWLAEPAAETAPRTPRRAGFEPRSSFAISFGNRRESVPPVDLGR
ncbi:glycosyltransferase family 4 protein [Marinivivus vitaminiproducens]|uniref:glycosyltransferase family 4 protein n=1 Tax=Marinivivus vitaminiproducens TaxID=3035935 RepID=UPI0027A47376|nr:glycosyltransferase family 4 protein [Geminicoccaceae bacterium SCSIO 64248]